MRPFRLVLAAAAAASVLGGAPAATAQHDCVQPLPTMRPQCVLPDYCVMYPDGTIRCYD
jgi:hypothetical protein